MEDIIFVSGIVYNRKSNIAQKTDRLRTAKIDEVGNESD
jgi:hypothetical protein